MLTSDARNALALAHEHTNRLREEAATECLRRSSGMRRALATSLRRVADRLDRTPLAPRPA